MKGRTDQGKNLIASELQTINNLKKLRSVKQVFEDLHLENEELYSSTPAPFIIATKGGAASGRKLVAIIAASILRCPLILEEAFEETGENHTRVVKKICKLASSQLKLGFSVVIFTNLASKDECNLLKEMSELHETPLAVFECRMDDVDQCWIDIIPNLRFDPWVRDPTKHDMGKIPKIPVATSVVPRSTIELVVYALKDLRDHIRTDLKYETNECAHRFLFNEHKEYQRLCWKCSQLVSGSFYYCCDCRLIAHETCSYFPETLNCYGWSQNVDMTLHLRNVVSELDTQGTCSCCMQLLSGRYYSSEDGHSLLGLDCLFSLPARCRTKLHQYKLTRCHQVTETRCAGCNATIGKNTIAYHCKLSSKTYDLYCVRLPETVEFDRHRHLFKLSIVPRDDHLRCEVCQNERDTTYWIYYCEECDYPVHTRCIVDAPSLLRSLRTELSISNQKPKEKLTGKEFQGGNTHFNNLNSDQIAVVKDYYHKHGSEAKELRSLYKELLEKIELPIVIMMEGSSEAGSKLVALALAAALDCWLMDENNLCITTTANEPKQVCYQEFYGVIPIQLLIGVSVLIDSELTDKSIRVLQDMARNLETPLFIVECKLCDEDMLEDFDKIKILGSDYEYNVCDTPKLVVNVTTPTFDGIKALMPHILLSISTYSIQWRKRHSEGLKTQYCQRHFIPLGLDYDVSEDEICDRCLMQLSNPILKCRDCALVLHKNCTELPLSIQACETNLTLEKFADNNDKVRCKCCDEFVKDYAYTSPQMMICLDCWFTLPKPRINLHEHPMNLCVWDSDVRCDACGMCCDNMLRYRCKKNDCLFEVSVKCSLLEESVPFDRHPHPLHLVVSPEHVSNQYYCEVCEEETDKKQWVYCCAECSYYIHVCCLVPILEMVGHTDQRRNLTGSESKTMDKAKKEAILVRQAAEDLHSKNEKLHSSAPAPFILAMNGELITGRKLVAFIAASILKCPLITEETFEETEENQTRVINRMCMLASSQLKLGRSVVIDTTLATENQFDQLKLLSELHETPLVVFECRLENVDQYWKDLFPKLLIDPWGKDPTKHDMGNIPKIPVATSVVPRSTEELVVYALKDLRDYIRPTLKYVSHKCAHRFLFNEHKEYRRLCWECRQLVSGSFYYCCDCRLIAHETCCYFPETLNLYDWSQTVDMTLHLRNVDSKVDAQATCSCCMQLLVGRYYSCEDGLSLLGLDCLFSLPATCRVKLHPHELTRRHQWRESRCSGCAATIGKNTIAYHCSMSGKQFDLYCLGLPEMAEFDRHRHPFKLSIVSREDHLPYYCEVCQEERDTSCWIYYCEECDYPIHTRCIVDASSLFKSLSTELSISNKEPKEELTSAKFQGCSSYLNNEIVMVQDHLWEHKSGAKELRSSFKELIEKIELPIVIITKGSSEERKFVGFALAAALDCLHINKDNLGGIINIANESTQVCCKAFTQVVLSQIQINLSVLIDLDLSDESIDFLRAMARDIETPIFIVECKLRDEDLCDEDVLEDFDKITNLRSGDVCDTLTVLVNVTRPTSIGIEASIAHILLSISAYSIQWRKRHRKITRYCERHFIPLGLEYDDPQGEICNRCSMQLSTPILKCRDCTLVLHKNCTELPLSIQASTMNFTRENFADNNDKPRCDCCNEFVKDYAYTSLQMAYTRSEVRICLDCWFTPPKPRITLHEHPMTLCLWNSDVKCDACGVDSDQKLRYRCIKGLECPSLFEVGVNCGMLEETVPFDRHRHPFQLIVSPERVSDQYYCEVCGEKRDKNHWVYCCVECDYDIHVRCLVPTGGCLR